MHGMEWSSRCMVKQLIIPQRRRAEQNRTEQSRAEQIDKIAIILALKLLMVMDRNYIVFLSSNSNSARSIKFIS